MTRKDYEVIAAAIRGAKAQHPPPAPCTPTRYQCGIRNVQHNIANALAADNPAFDRERFLKACQP